jgi:integrase/recombinase XerD
MLLWDESRNQAPFDLNTFVKRDFKEYRLFLLKNLKPATVNRHLATLKQFFNWAVSRKLLTEDVVPRMERVKSKPRSQPVKRYLDAIQQRQLIDTVHSRGNARDLAAILLMIGAGLRVSELCNLRAGDLEPESPNIHVVIRGNNLANSRRIPLLLPAALPLVVFAAKQAVVAANARANVPFWFGTPDGPITRRAVEMLVQRCARISQLPNITPLVLRDTFCMNLCASPMNPFLIAKYAGLADVRALRTYYERLAADNPTMASSAGDPPHSTQFTESFMSKETGAADSIRRSSPPDRQKALPKPLPRDVTLKS